MAKKTNEDKIENEIENIKASIEDITSALERLQEVIDDMKYIKSEK